MIENVHLYRSNLRSDYERSRSRVFFLDYDGTLVPFHPLPHQAAPVEEVREILKLLADDPANRVVVVSGREPDSLEQWMGDLPVTLVAEHGGFLKMPDKPWRPFLHTTTLWKDKVYPSMKALTLHYEGSFLEDKRFSYAWHYRAIADRVSTDDIRQIMSALRALRAYGEFVIYDEDCVIELRSAEVNKGAFATRYLWEGPSFDFVLAMGDGRTDEDLFDVIAAPHYSIRVGRSIASSARLFLNRQEDVLPLFRMMLSTGYIDR